MVTVNTISRIRIAAQQPYFLPDFYFFYKISQSDIFIIADFLKYRKQSAMNRAALGKDFKPGYLSVPVHHEGRTSQLPACDVRMIDKQQWTSRHLRTISSLYRKYPFFDFFFPELEHIYRKNHAHLSDFLNDLILWQKNIIFPDKKIYIASQQKICSIGDLKGWIDSRYPVHSVYYYPHEAAYYRTHFTGDILVRLNDQNLPHFPSGYETAMPVIILLFLVGPEVVLYFSGSLRP